MYNPQMYYNKIDNQIRELEAMKGQIPQPITQNFQLSGNNIIYVDSIDEVEKTFIVNDTPFFSKDLSILWLKKSNGSIKTYELNEIVQKDEKDLKIEYLQAQIDELKKGNKYESNTNTNGSTAKPIKEQKS